LLFDIVLIRFSSICHPVTLLLLLD